MTTTLPDSAYETLNRAKDALNKGELQRARRLALRAVRLAPEHEEPWLYLASVSSPEASISYLKKALEINPTSTQAKKGMHWAIQRFRKTHPGQKPKKVRLPVSIAEKALVSTQPSLLSWSTAIVILIAVLLFWLWTPDFSFALPSFQSTPQITLAAGENVRKVTFTPTPTNTPTPTPTPTNTPTPTITPTPKPTKVPKTYPDYIRSVLPNGVYPDERWFDINLSTQRMYAYDGDKLIKTFVVSTGLPGTPTVTGRFRVYVKYTSTLMTGPGYYLPNVPWTMYFYDGYGIHGTYWHNNFGHPMSHGCINMRNEDAQWAFGFASVGTLVNIHY
ncbi:MAG: L,D-transpeptidase family protein [Anaerolineales bacterium]